MGKQNPKMTALVVSAIRSLREVQGSTPKEIMNFIQSEYNSANRTSELAIQRELKTALKRGLEYGILRQKHGHYSLNTDPETIATTENMLMGPMDRGGRGCKGAMKRKPRRRPKGRKGCKGSSRRTRRRGGGGGGKKRRRGGKGRSRGGRCKSGGGGGGRRRGRSSRRRGGRRSKKGGKRRRSGKRSGSRRGKSCDGRRGGEDVDILAKDPIELGSRHREKADDSYAYERPERRSQSRGRQSARSRSRTRSRSRSSGSSEHDGNQSNRRDRQEE